MANPFDGSSASGGGGMGSPWGGGGGGMGGMGSWEQMLGGLFGNSGGPYGSGMNEYQKWAQQGIGAQQPFYNAGVSGMGNYQRWLNGMQDPSKFINNLMGQYQASPYSQYLQQQAIRSGQNAASMGGNSATGEGGAGMGSTPFAQQLQQNAGNISSGDMNQWLQNVLGVNTQYGQGEQNLMGVGQGAANQMSNMYGNMANAMGGGAYNQAQAGQNDMWNSIMGGAGILGL